MQRFFYGAMAVAVFAFAAEAHSTCYEIYRNDVMIYRSSVAPVDMSRPFRETVPAAFGAGATMLFQQRSNSCDLLDARLSDAGNGTVAEKQSGRRPGPTLKKSPLVGTVEPKPRLAASWDNSSFANEDSRDGETFSGNSGGSGTVYTGPRGGQYQINSHGNKSYLSSGGGSRGGRR